MCIRDSRKRWVRRLMVRVWKSEHLLSEYRRLSNAVKAAVRDFRSRRFYSLCTKVQESFNTSPSDFWKKVKRLHSPPKPEIPILADGRRLVRDSVKAAAFRDELQAVYSHPDSPDFDHTM